MARLGNRSEIFPMYHLALLAASLIWGFAFVMQRTAMVSIGPLYYGGIRFALGAAALLIFFGVRRFLIFAKTEWRTGITIGIFLTAGAISQQVGMVYTTAGKGGFITGLYIIFVPLFLRAIWKVQIAVGAALGVTLAAVGLYLLSVNEDFSINRGDLWVLGCALAFAFHVIYIGRLGASRDPIGLSIFQYLVCACTCLALAPFFENLSLEALNGAAGAILYGGLVSAAVGFTLQVIGQRHVSATSAGLLLSLESVFAALSGWLILSEQLQTKQLAGCVLMLAGILVAQLMPTKNLTQAPTAA